MTELTSLKIEQRNQSKLLMKIETLLDQKYEGALTDTWTKTFGEDFPLKDIKILYDIEKKLIANPELKTNFVIFFI